MNKIALTLILLILPFSLVHTSPRKKVGIVLSGGGAKGVAHIGVIKALEELNIPIDYIAGTSGKSSVSCPLKPSDSAPLKHSTMPP